MSATNRPPFRDHIDTETHRIRDDQMVFERLSLANFHGFEQIELTFGPRLKVNGAGTSGKRFEVL